MNTNFTRSIGVTVNQAYIQTSKENLADYQKFSKKVFMMFFETITKLSKRDPSHYNNLNSSINMSYMNDTIIEDNSPRDSVEHGFEVLESDKDYEIQIIHILERQEEILKLLEFLDWNYDPLKLNDGLF